MKFSDEAIIISSKKHGENSLIIKLLSKNYGICNIYAKNAVNSKSYSRYEIGNLVYFDLYAKNNNSLAYAKIENIESFSSRYIYDIKKIRIIRLFSLVISDSFMDLDPNQDLFLSFLEFLKNLNQDNKNILANIIKFEIKLLEIFGYGLDLSCCAVTGSNKNLYFLSPKSGRVVSKEIGKPYEDKLFKLTDFFKSKLILSDNILISDLLQTLDITKFFMKKYQLFKNNFNYCDRKLGY
jgi:DNA repair protein RecO (recombination protein O)